MWSDEDLWNNRRENFLKLNWGERSTPNKLDSERKEMTHEHNIFVSCSVYLWSWPLQENKYEFKPMLIKTLSADKWFTIWWEGR